MGGFGMHQRNGQAVEQPEGHEALFRVVEAIVLERERQAGEDAFGICEVEPVIGEIGRSLDLRPAEGDIHIVYTLRIYIKISKPWRLACRHPP